MKIVQKYGGSSLADKACVQRVAKRVIADSVGNQVLVVVSAQGKTTDALTEKYRELSSKFPSRESDALLITGEQASAALLAATIRELGHDAISLNGAQIPIFASGSYGAGEISCIKTDRIKKEWDLGKIIIVTGFQGIDSLGNLVTLGRGGSDTSAVALAAALHADRCMIFTDVDGVYSTDPRKEKDAHRFSDIKTDSMLRFAVAGAKVLHPRAAELALQYQVPLEILSSFSNEEGTTVSESAPPRTGLTSRKEGDLSYVSVLFATPPSAPLLNEILSICCALSDEIHYGRDSLCAGFSINDYNTVMASLHKILFREQKKSCT